LDQDMRNICITAESYSKDLEEYIFKTRFSNKHVYQSSRQM